MKTVTKIERESARAKKRVAAYCRVSTDKDEQKESLANQMSAFNVRIATHPEWELASIYVDVGLSGTSMTRRVQFKQMIEDCKSGKIDYIITKSVSRFARNTVDTLTTVRELKDYGVELFFEKEGIDTADSTSEMLLTIMASFAQEESRSISENVKWGIRKRFEAGEEVKVPLYGFYHTDDELFLIQEDEAKVVREVFERYVHGEAPLSIVNDMTARGVKPPAGNRWKRLQLDRMIKNEKYVGDSVLQKTYTENHLTHKQIRNHGDLPQFRVKDAHAAIVDRHIFEQAQTISDMRNVKNGNSTYPYGKMLRCPCCGRVMVHGGLNDLYYAGKKIQNGGWGCYGEDGCGRFLVIQNVLDEAVKNAYFEKHGERKESVDFYWLDDTMDGITLGEDTVEIRWKDGETSTAGLEFVEERYMPYAYADFYNNFLDRIRSGEKKNKYKNLMGLGRMEVPAE